MDISERGEAIEVRPVSGKAVRGWLWARTPLGFFVALDREGTDIRYIPAGAYMSSRRDDRAEFSVEGAEELEERIEELDNKLEQPLKTAIRHLDHSKIAQAVVRARDLQREVMEPPYRYHRSEGAVPAGVGEFLDAEVEETIETYKVVHQEMEEAGVLDVIDQNSDEIASLPLKYSLPEADVPLIVSGGLSDLSKERSLKSRHIRDQLRTIADRKLLHVIRSIVDASDRPSRASEGGKPRKGKRARCAGAAIRVAGGTALAGANAGLGLTAGFMSSLMTIGMTTIPVAVGVATSMYTGLVQVADGLEKIGALLDESDSE